MPAIQVFPELQIEPAQQGWPQFPQATGKHWQVNAPVQVACEDGKQLSTIIPPISHVQKLFGSTMGVGVGIKA
jgi:hypothetical protein